MPETLAFLGVALSICATGTHALLAASFPSQYGEVTWPGESSTDTCVEFKAPFEQIQTDSCFNGLPVLGKNTRQGLHRGIAIDQWFGRLGNNLMQVAHAIFAAKLSGQPRVTTPSGGELGIRRLFQLPLSFEVESDSDFRTRVNCSENEKDSNVGSTYYHLACIGTTRSDYTGVLRKYILPYLIDEARDACEQEASNTKVELVIHLRSGDLLNSTHFQSRFAPCSFFDVLVEQDITFERVRVITEPDLKHPCLEYFVEKKKNITVQSESFSADACALMHADYLGLGSLSTFSAALSLFNPNHVTVYDPFRQCHHIGAHDCPFAKRVRYCIPDIREIRTGSDKIDWMLHYPKENITKDGVQCFQ